MGRKLRYIPEEGALVEVTCRTLQGRLLLRPSPELNDIAALLSHPALEAPPDPPIRGASDPRQRELVSPSPYERS